VGVAGPSEGKGGEATLLDQVPCFHGNIDRAEAERRLVAEGIDGLYLLRTREPANTGLEFALSCLFKGRCNHSKISYTATGIEIDDVCPPDTFLPGVPLNEVLVGAPPLSEHSPTAPYQLRPGVCHALPLHSCSVTRVRSVGWHPWPDSLHASEALCRRCT
jgi:hypothetical protein